jgi:hypothetical protein
MKIGPAIEHLAQVLIKSFARIERQLDIITTGLGLDGADPAQLRETAEEYRGMRAGWAPQHPVMPAEGYALHPVFDGHGREIMSDVGYVGLDFPLTATCGCGRQIVKLGPDEQWAHCD